ncbi:DUF2207 domain-containing protein [Halobacillus salinus]|uniref:DUF2207 domain-containing protein n=1 Tax=Halobacillus salinus TaxID=192814 RepID=A0A4Z0GYI3_9BACI|nr:DUF2207 domain-containing protein [Halobacillus salinus]TGB02416.1 DUF2207 domain-containing protein [Halobacillus salinus]
MIKRQVSAIIMVLAVILFPTQVFAVEFDIEKSTIEANLQENAAVEVTEQHTYTFEGEFNGITRALFPKEGTSIQDVHATENGKNLEIGQDDNTYKVYRPGEDETFTITLTYTIENGADVYNDVAEFYWPFFDQRNESTFEDLTITVTPPEPATDPIAFGYDQAYGTESINDQGSVTFSLGEVSGGSNGDVRVAYDASLFPAADVAADKDMRQDILEAKQSLENEATALAKRKKFMNTIAPYVLGAFLVVGVGLMIHRLRKRRETEHELDRQAASTSPFPKDAMSLPGMVSFMNHGVLSTNAMTASLLDLVRKGLVEQVSEKEFRLLHRRTDYKHEDILIEWLFDEIADGRELDLEDLKDYAANKKKRDVYQRFYERWKYAVQEEVRRMPLRDEGGKVWRTVSGIAAFAMVPFAIIFPISDLFGWMFASIALLVFFLLFSIFYRPLSVEGLRIHNQLAPLKWSEKWKDWEHDDQIPAMLFQVAMGRRDNMLKEQMPNSWRPATSQSDWIVYLALASLLQEDFETANTSAAVAGAGITSSGNSAGGVGGGGGGAGGF